VKVIDVHTHVYESKAIGSWSKAAYEVWEYGAAAGVRFSGAAGDLEDLRTAMRAGGVEHAVIVNAFSIDEWRDRRLAGLEPDPAPLGAQLIRFNQWLVDAVAHIPEITPFVALDPWVLTVAELTAHLERMHRSGARGVKIHPVEQRFRPSDPRMLDLFRACKDLGMTVLSHSGTSRGEIQFGEPREFAEVARAVPGLQLVVAHLGGGSWPQITELAQRCPQVSFDLCEIVAWVGAPNAPTASRLVQIIREIGVDRVMFGSDFPWYDPGEMARVVMGLPGLSEGEVAAILWENAARILTLPRGF
jgi:uncharacterized protein